MADEKGRQRIDLEHLELGKLMPHQHLELLLVHIVEPEHSQLAVAVGNEELKDLGADRHLQQIQLDPRQLTTPEAAQQRIATLIALQHGQLIGQSEILQYQLQAKLIQTLHGRLPISKTLRHVLRVDAANTIFIWNFYSIATQLCRLLLTVRSSLALLY